MLRLADPNPAAANILAILAILARVYAPPASNQIIRWALGITSYAMQRASGAFLVVHASPAAAAERCRQSAAAASAATCESRT
eukprot:SAG25_NODE_131_length_14413_cov_29.573984_2_plen_83_part_00